MLGAPEDAMKGSTGDSYTDGKGKTVKVTPDRPECKYRRNANGGVKGGQRTIHTSQVIAASVDTPKDGVHKGRQVLTLRVVLGEEYHLTGDSALTGEGNGGTLRAIMASVKGSAEGLTDPVTGKAIPAGQGTFALTIEGPRHLPTQAQADAVYAAGPQKAAKSAVIGR